jgi:hypothetical protein
VGLKYIYIYIYIYMHQEATRPPKMVLWGWDQVRKKNHSLVFYGKIFIFEHLSVL